MAADEVFATTNVNWEWSRFLRGLIYPQPRRCYKNSFCTLLIRPEEDAHDLVYVEGYIILPDHPRPIPHGWVETVAGTVLEVTPDDDGVSEYPNPRFIAAKRWTRDEMLAEIGMTGVLPLLGDPRQNGSGWDEDQALAAYELGKQLLEDDRRIDSSGRQNA